MTTIKPPKLTYNEIKTKIAHILNENPDNIKSINKTHGNETYMVGVGFIKNGREELQSKMVSIKEVEECDA